MVCHPGVIRALSLMLDISTNMKAPVNLITNGDGDAPTRCNAQCLINKTLTVESLQAHMRKVHRRDASSATAVTPPAEVSCTYKLNLVFRSENSHKIVDFPVQDCLYQEVTATNLTLLSFLQSAPLTRFIHIC